MILSKEAEKQYRKLKRSGLKLSILDAVEFLLYDLELSGPILKGWPNYSPLKGKKDQYHCHLKKGRPTLVVCWRVNKKENTIEVFYVGSHEGAPY